MTRGLLLLIALELLTLLPCAQAQESFSLDEYFRGTGVELQSSTNQPAPRAAESIAQPSPPATQFTPRPAPLPAPNASFGATYQPPKQPLSKSQIDPITGLPIHMTSLGMSDPPRSPGPDQGLTPFSLSSGMAPASSAPWTGFPSQSPSTASAIVTTGHTGPIVFEGRIEPLDGPIGLASPPLAGGGVPLVAFNGELPNAPLPEERIASSVGGLPELHDFGELTNEWLKELQSPTNDRTMEDLCVSRKGYVVLEHWGYHAAALAGNGDLFGVVSTNGTFTLSFPKLVDGLTVRPQFGGHFLSGPSKTDMPNLVHDVMVETGWMQPLSDRIHLRLAGTVGAYTDFHQSNLTDSLRVSGLAIGTFEATEDLQIVLGAAYINLANRKVLPVAGIVYHPHDDLRLELMFPEAKLSHRIDPGKDHARWLYVGSSFFGRTWNLERTSGATEDVTYSDWRLGLGLESHQQSRAVWYVEIGAALGRELEYESHLGDYKPSPTGYLRGGIYY